MNVIVITAKGIQDAKHIHPVKLTFETWLQKMDSELSKTLPVSYLDLPDRDYREWYDAGWTPKDAAEEIVAEEIEEMENFF